MIRVLICVALLAVSTAVKAQTLPVEPVTQGVWAIVGPKEQRNPENLANNATFGLVATKDGAVLIDAGGSWAGAEDLFEAIRTVTDLPITHVINTGGQDHRWLGNGYWQSKGATIIASQAAIADQKDRGSMQMSGLRQLIGDALEGTQPAYADIAIDGTYKLELGDITFEITHAGPAHTPGDAFVFVPERSTVFTGDIVYVERILGVGDQSSITNWPAAFEAMAATGAMYVVPGHGSPTTLEKARADTYDYLMNLRAQISALIDDGGDIIQSPSVDQSAFKYLEQFEALAGRNAQTAFQQMEWE